MALADYFRPRADINADIAASNAANTNAAANQNKGASPVPDTSTVKEGTIPGAPGNQPNPLDIYKQMLENAGKDSGNTAPSFSIDPKILDDVAGSMDFTQGVSKELMEKAGTGDVASMMELIQATSRNAYKAALSHQAKLTDTHLAQRSTFDTTKIDGRIRAGLVGAQLSSVANYSHPVARQELNRAAEAYATAHPDASPQQVAAAAHQYLTDLASALNPTTTVAGKDSKGDNLEMDWASYLTK